MGKEFCGEGDGVLGLLQEQGQEEVGQENLELGVLLDVGGVGLLQLLLRRGGQGGHGHRCPRPGLCAGVGGQDAWVLSHT